MNFICTDLIHTYYSSSSFTTVVGTWEKDCDDVVTSSGTTSDWRRTDSYGCATGTHTVFCAHWTGTQWEQISCP